MKNSREALKSSTKNFAGDFIQQSRFSVDIDGIGPVGAKKVEGLEHEHEMVVYQDSDDHFIRLRPGRQKVGTLVLERYWSGKTDLFDWFKTVYDGKVERKSISIVYHTDEGGESSRVNLMDCWPKKWKLHGLHSRSSGHVLETVEIMYERVVFG